MKNNRSVQSLRGFACLMLAKYHVVDVLSAMLGPVVLERVIALSPMLSQWLKGVFVRREQQKALAIATTAQLAKSTP